MLRLMLLRHAKSSWADPGLDDRDRPLSPRGSRAARSMGQFMRERALIPDLVLCSPARRARDTWKLAAEELKTKPRLLIEEAVYDFGNGGRVWQAVCARGESAPVVLVVGHNPSIERLALRLAGLEDTALRAQIERKYPTGSLVVFDFEVERWAEATETNGRLVSFTRPKDIVEH